MEKIKAQFGILISSVDIAGINMKENILDISDAKEIGVFDNRPVFRINRDVILVETARDLLYENRIDEIYDVNYWIFASRHKAESGIATLTAHSPGNWTSENTYGGEPEELCPTDPALIKSAIRNIYIAHKIHRPSRDYRVSLEVTHHGPTELKRPCVFMEIGSGPDQWSDRVAGRLMAEAILKTCASLPATIGALGFGGGHYPEKFTNISLFSEYSTGHIMPKYVSEKIRNEIIDEAIKKNGYVDLAIIDWKGLKSAVRKKIIDRLEMHGIEYVKSSSIDVSEKLLS